MKLYPLHIGNTKIPYGQFYGGKEWTGWRGFWRFVTDKSHAIMVPIYAYLIEHQEAGLVDCSHARSHSLPLAVS